MADTGLTPGTYATQVTYTAIADAPSYGITSVSPNILRTDQQSNKTITIMTSAPDTELAFGDVSVKIGNVDLTDCNEITNNDYRGVTCTYNGNLPAGTYSVELTSSWHNAIYLLQNGFTIRNVIITDLEYMQDITTDICNNTPTHTTARLKDSRGMGNAGSDKTSTYGIVKAKDGNCWMTDNLNLYNVTISADTSDFTSPTSYTIPASITATTDWNTNNYQTKKVEVAQGMGQDASSDAKYEGQVYYNWTVAVAKEDTTSYTTTGPDTSICPRGWTLPTNGDKGVNRSWAKLLDTYGITTGPQLLANSTLGFSLYYGYWRWSYASERYQGSGGYFWSGTPSSETNAYFLFYNSGTVGSQLSGKGDGFSIRCVAR